ncbi:MAG TPA: dioxygenase [bacterium]|jgi:protocatechuate 3,4-dioxygenase beta subunit
MFLSARILMLFAALCAVALLTAGPTATLAAPRAVMPPAPTCTASPPATPAQTEGPYYKANSPERSSLIEPGMPGTKIIVTGYVLGRDCKPIAGARLDFWQADAQGTYDNAGYRLRGHQSTNAAGIYSLETILPGLYPGRTRHIHVKVQPPGGPVLTTQLYFPGESHNQTDGIFNRALLVDMKETRAGKVAFFTFVMAIQR